MNHEDLIDVLAQFEKTNQDFYVMGNFHGGVSVSDCIKKSKELALRLSE